MVKKNPMWKQYAQHVFKVFQAKYPDDKLLLDQTIVGRYSHVGRQIDVLVRVQVAGRDRIGVFDCTCFTAQVDVPVIDAMIGFMGDVGARIGGVVTTKGCSPGAEDRAKDPDLDLVVIPFESPEQLAERIHALLQTLTPRTIPSDEAEGIASIIATPRGSDSRLGG
jgi:hypothetical protein